MTRGPWAKQLVTADSPVALWLQRACVRPCDLQQHGSSTKVCLWPYVSSNMKGLTYIVRRYSILN